MKNKTLMMWAVIALLVGVAGMIAVSGLFGGPSVPGTFSSPGQQIFYTGATSAGPIPRTVAGGGMTGLGMMGNVACVDCHGEDGRGGRVGMRLGSVDIPDIRYSTLSTARSEEGTTIPAWTDLGACDQAPDLQPILYVRARGPRPSLESPTVTAALPSTCAARSMNVTSPRPAVS